MLTFDPKQGISVSEVGDVRTQVRTQWQQALAEEGKPLLNVSVDSPAGQLIDSQTAAIVQKDSELLFLAQQFNPLTAEGQWQDALGKIYFLTRHQAIASTVTARCLGVPGTAITRGSKIRSVVDGTDWELQETIVINDASYADGVFACTKTGPISAAANTLTKIITVTTGWDSVSNEEAATVGQDEESQASFEYRRYQSVALNSRSSLQSAYSRIAALDGVIAVAARQNRTERLTKVDGVAINPHSVYFCVLGGQDEDIARALYETVSAGCAYTGTTTVEVQDSVTRAKDQVSFSRPNELAVKMVVYLVQLATTSKVVEEDVKNIIYQNFYGLDAAQPAAGSGLPAVQRVTMDTKLYASRFVSALVNAGYNYVTKITMAMPKNGTLREQLTIPINVCPSLSLDDITIVWLPVAPIVDGQYFGFDNPDGDNGLAAGFDQAPFYSEPEPEPEPDTGDTEQEGEQDTEPGEQGTQGTEQSEPGEQSETAEPVVTMALDSAENVLPHLQTVAPQTKAKPRTPRRPKSERRKAKKTQGE